MNKVNNRFWRLEPTPGSEPTSVLESQLLIAPDELVAKLRPFDVIVIATWNPDAEEGEVHGLGVVQEVKGPCAVVDWRRYRMTLSPSRQGATQWKKRAFFKFDELVAKRYRLMDHFDAAFEQGDSVEAVTHLLPVAAESVPTARRKDTSSARGEPEFASESLEPQCNRVGPDGRIFSTRARGTFMGNRTSPPRWLICDLHFERDLKEPRKYTKLFFLDEAVALAAGHRPCNTCRRERFKAYVSAVSTELDVRGAAGLDTLLNVARSAPYGRSPVDSLPNGAFISDDDGSYWLKWLDALHQWTPSGYVDGPVAPAALQIDGVTVLTPTPSLVALSNGYVPQVHHSAL